MPEFLQYANKLLCDNERLECSQYPEIRIACAVNKCSTKQNVLTAANIYILVK